MGDTTVTIYITPGHTAGTLSVLVPVKDHGQPHLAMEWGASHHPGMTDIAATLAAPLPWDDSAAEQHIAWMLRVGATWWDCFASLAGGPEVKNASPEAESPEP